MSGYIGASPVPQATQHREAFTATASQTSFPTAGYTPQFVDVYLNGVKLAAADYTATNGSDIVLTTGAALNDILEIVAYTPFEVANQTFTGTTTVDVLTTTGAFTSLGIDDNATSTAVTIDASGNVGIGTAPVSAGTGWSALQLGGNSVIFGDEAAGASKALYVTQNSYHNGTDNLYISTDEASRYTQTGGTHVWHNAASGTAGAAITFTERMRIDSSGHAIIPAGVTLGTAAGVYSAANTLDDYEEGTWTPALSTDGTQPTWSSFGIQSADYTKIGNMVKASCYLTFNITSTGSGTARISGLPFVAGEYAAVKFAHGSLIGSNGGYTGSGSTLIVAIQDFNIWGSGVFGTGDRRLMVMATYKTDS